jgi:transcriptional regulator with XRE-family HTH domain
MPARTDVETFSPIPQILKMLREERGLSQKKLEAKMDAGKGIVSRWEGGDPPNRKNLSRVLEVLGCTPKRFAQLQVKVLAEEFDLTSDLQVEFAFRRRLERARELLEETSLGEDLCQYFAGRLDRYESTWKDCTDAFAEIEQIIQQHRSYDGSREPKTEQVDTGAAPRKAAARRADED